MVIVCIVEREESTAEPGIECLGGVVNSGFTLESKPFDKLVNRRSPQGVFQKPVLLLGTSVTLTQRCPDITHYKH